FSHVARAPPSLHSVPTRRSSDLASAIRPRRLESRSRKSASAGSRRSYFASTTKSPSGGSTSFRIPLALIATERNCAVLSSSLRSEEHTSELQSRENLVCRLLLEKKKKTND